jgi:hypothetical protein
MKEGKPTASWTARVCLVLLTVLALANVGFAVARAVDAVIAGGGQPPSFSLLLPMWVQPESRPMQLAVLLAVPALSMVLPMALMLPGVVSFFLRRGPGKSWVWPVAALTAGSLCLAVNVLCAHIPELAEGMLYRLTCPGWHMVIPGSVVAIGLLGHVIRRRERRPGTWTAAFLVLGGACLIVNAITTYAICHAVPSM